jgi:hypothetical protein
LTISPKGHSSSGRKRELGLGAVYGRGFAERRFEFIPFWGFLVFLLYSMRRVDCRGCEAVVVEEVPWGDGKQTSTNAYMLFPARWARRISWKAKAPAHLAVPRGQSLASYSKQTYL